MIGRKLTDSYLTRAQNSGAVRNEIINQKSKIALKNCRNFLLLYTVTQK